ncbi:hypothetical protein GSI_14916 [Ganoderma sinense ZZ0214-1]|uniref:Uncharacterized protein n=1 Tax=Ganoderma sinense ZZ0214-1 TaxID=1077348 RepID=A0A2G8RQ25_9APHY|nr:hypothetical protein GSI_14916 [Ganoderma sinense ZZ0214-1]
MAHLMGRAAPPQSRGDALDVPQPAYVYGLLLLNEFSLSIPPHLFQSVLPPGVTPPEEARRDLERAAYLNFAPAQYKLGHACGFTAPPFPFDALPSVQYYPLTSQQGEIEADIALSKWFLCGVEGTFDEDEGLAWTFAEEAARKDLLNPEFALGYGADAQAFLREQHENLTDSKLVRKRTQAKQRSEARGAVGGSRPVPASQRTEIEQHPQGLHARPPRRLPRPQPQAWREGHLADARAPLTGSPSGMGQSAPLPRVDEYANANGQRRASGPAHNNSLYPNAPPGQGQGQPHPHHHQQPTATTAAAAAPTTAAAAAAASTAGPTAQPAQPPLARPPAKGPQTFAEMGIATTKVDDDSNCVVMCIDRV